MEIGWRGEADVRSAIFAASVFPPPRVGRLAHPDTEPVVSYGDPEPDPDRPPIYRGTVSEHGFVTLYPYEQYRRKRFETWWENGRRMGRWTWESL